MADSNALTGTALTGHALLGSLGDTPPPYLRASGACWKLITDPKAIEAAQDAINAQGTADQASQDATAAAEAAAIADALAQAAQIRADEAKGDAATAQSAADQAAADALAAAGVAEGKGQVIVQATAPTGTRASETNLWIRASDSQVHRYDIATSTWVAVTDPAAISAAQAAADAQQAADDAAGVAADALATARYAPRIADRAPTISDGTNKPDGAGWMQYADGLLTQFWRWDGNAWLRLDMDPVMVPVIQIGTGTAGDLTADRVVVTGEFVARVAQILQLGVGHLVVTDGAVINTLVAQAIAGATAEFQTAYIQNLRTNGAIIDEAVIGDLAANIITSGLFRTSATGQRLEIDSSGLIMYGIDANDVEYELVRIGPAGENLITAGDTTISPSGVQASSGDFGELNVGGQSLEEWFVPYPKGVVGFAHTASNSAWHGDGSEIRRLEVSATVQPYRRYRVALDQHFVELRTGAASTCLGRLKYGPGGNMNIFASTRWMLEATTLAQTVSPLLGYLDTSSLTAEEEWTIGFTTQGPSGRDMRILTDSGSARLRLTVEDIGPTIASTGEVLMSGGTAVEGAGGGTTDPPKTTRHTKTYTSTEAVTYNADGSFRSSSEVTQGLYGGGPTRFNRRGGWKFPSFTGDLSGATVEKIQMYIYLDSSWSSAGATVNPSVHNGNILTSLSTFSSVYNWKRGTGKWITLPSSLYAGFKSGAYKGIGVKPTNTSTSQYAIFNASGAKLRITYTK